MVALNLVDMATSTPRQNVGTPAGQKKRPSRWRKHTAAHLLLSHFERVCDVRERACVGFVVLVGQVGDHTGVRGTSEGKMGGEQRD